MTKLYHAAEGWQVPGRQAKRATRVDVPNAPDDLAAWLNDRAVPAEASPVQLQLSDEDRELIGEGKWLTEAARRHYGTDGPPLGLASEPAAEPHPGMTEHAEARRMAIGRCPRCNGTPRGAHLLLKGQEKDAIVEFIEQADELWMIEAIAHAVRDKVRALGLASEEQGGVQ